MLFILLSILLFSAVLCGWGYLLLRTLKLKINAVNPWLLFFVGYGFLIIIIGYISIFRKLDALALLFIVFLGLLSWLFYLKDIFPKKPKISFEKLLIFFVALVFIFCVALSLSSSDFPASGDTTGYHLGIVAWSKNFPLVKGLVNLHFRLGSYSGYLQLSAVLDNYKWSNQSPFVMPGLFIFGFFMYCAWEVIFSLLKTENIRLKIWSFFYFFSLLLLTIFYYFQTSSGPNLYYDALSMLLAAVILNEIVKNIFIKNIDDVQSDLSFIFMINILAVAAYLSKQNAALVMITTVAFSIYFLKKRKKLNLKNIPIFFGLPVIGISGSMVSNIITSGYPLFPFPFLHLDLPWTTSKKIVYDAYISVKYWAKMPGTNYMSVADNGFFYWFLPWIKRNLADSIFMTVVFIPFISGMIFWLGGMAIWFKEGRKLYWIFLVNILSLLYWFLMAPDIRFGAIFFVVFLSSGLSFLALAINNRHSYFFEKVLKYKQTLAVFFVVFISIYSFYASEARSGYSHIKNIYYIENKLPDEYFEKEIEAKDGGHLTVYMPKDGECRSKLPCTPYDPQSIGAFDSRNMGAGFFTKLR